MNNIWCTLVMLGDEYAKGAMVVAQTLKNCHTKYPIWCAVTEDVSENCKSILAQLFDNVVVVPLLKYEVPEYKSVKQREIYGKWIKSSFTKWNICDPTLFPVNKVILVDADMIFLDNCDELFDLPGFAMTFSSPWSTPYKKTKPIGNPYGILKHGEIVKHEDIKKGLNNSIVGLACMILVQPSIKLISGVYDLLLSPQLSKRNNCKSGYDEQFGAILAIKTNTPVYHIHQKYNWIVGKTDWLIDEKPKSQQYYNDKPWRLDPNTTEWEDVKQWWTIAKELFATVPQYQSLYN